VHEKRSLVSSSWEQLPSLPEPDASLTLTFALVPNQAESVEDHLHRVSDPHSPSYGKHWTPAEVVRRFAPDPQGIRAITDWLLQSGVQPQRISQSNDGTLIFVNSTIREAEILLHAEYHLFRDKTSGERHAACEEYSLPSFLRPYVDFVGPTVHLGLGTLITARAVPYHPAANKRGQGISRTPRSPALVRRQASSSDGCSRFITPDCLRRMYRIPTLNASHPDNALGVYQHAWSSWLPGDLDGFFDMFAPKLKGSRPIMKPINGGYWQDKFQGFPFNAEADLDFEYTMTLVQPLPVVNYQVGDISGRSSINSLLAAFDEHYCGALNSTFDGLYPNPVEGGYNKTADCGTITPAKVVSVSYAWNEGNLPEAYLRRQCQQFAKLGLMGVSVITASADCGVGGQTCECVDPVTGKPNGHSDRGAFQPTTPSICPYVTSVGGTQLPVNGTVSSREVAYHRLSDNNFVSSSGGGFSRVFEAPEWQKNFTERYLTTQARELANITGRYNPRGRGIPDISANAANFVTVINGGVATVFGTSASTPVFASIITLINDARLRAGKSTVGFLNPVLYANSHLMTDIVDGRNHGCGTEGFHAAEGWDPVTGLGTPDYERLLQLYMSLP